MISKTYEWLKAEPGPKILKEALNCYGIYEFRGAENNPVIIEWAKEIGGWIGGWYSDDSIPWCGLFVGICAKRAGFPFTQKMLSAREWLNWGQPVTRAMLGDVVVFERVGGGHVGFYVGEDSTHYHILGGNQSDQVNIMRLARSRAIGIRRCQWKIKQPANIKQVFLAPIRR